MMNKNIFYTILWFVGAIAVLGVIIWIAKPQSGGMDMGSQTGNAADAVKISKISAEELSFDFSTVSMAAGKISHIFKIKNSSADSVNIGKIYTSCMCTSASLEIGGEKIGPFGMAGHGFIPAINKTLAAGEWANIEVIFDPAAHGPAGVGPIKRSVYIENSGKMVELQISANVTP